MKITEKTKNIIKSSLIISFLLLVFGLSLTGCSKEEKIKVAVIVPYCAGEDNRYIKWLKHSDSLSFEYLELSLEDGIENAEKLLKLCSGFVLIGGEDVHPDFYGQASDSSRCAFFAERDTFEFKAIEIAKKLNLPVLGICRGEQILNVAYGGSLVVDIPSDWDTSVIHRHDSLSYIGHIVYIVSGTELHKTVAVDSAVATSNHHQAVNRIAPGFIPSAYSSDSLIEGIERVVPDSNIYIVGVQWHPEKTDYASPLSLPIATGFLKKVKKYYLRKTNV